MNCQAVRDLLAERALGALDNGDVEDLDRHLAWCAACRKEARELDHAAATFGFGLAPADPDPGLEDRVVEKVQSAAARGSGRRSYKRTVALVLAASIALGGVLWGSAMARRAATFQNVATQARIDERAAIDRYVDSVLQDPLFVDAENEVFTADLSGRGDATAGGAAVTVAAPNSRDLVLLMLTGMRPSKKQPLPYRAMLVSDAGVQLLIGKVRSFDSDGRALMSRELGISLDSFDRVVVRDADGRIVLTGTLKLRSANVSPRPASTPVSPAS